MKIEDSVNFARESGVWEYAGAPEEKAEQYLRFAKLVEQATLERAANKAESVGHHWSGAPARAFFELADEIRALKDSNE